MKKTYVLAVYCRRGGVSRDAGEHARGEYKSDAEAISNLRAKARGLKRYYDEVFCTILDKERRVAEFSV